MRELIERQLAQNNTVDVSGALNNCFFHSLALYYLINGFPLPEELFLAYPSDCAALTAIKQLIPSEKNLDLFYQYTTQVKQQREPATPLFLYEKTILLGVLFRSWCTHELLLDETNKALRFQNQADMDAVGVSELAITFMSLVTNYMTAYTDDEIANFEAWAQGNPIYEANKAFFREVSPFNVMEDKVVEIAQDYWEKTGYANYCKYLGGQIKVSYAEFCTLLKDRLHIPFVLYDQNGHSVIYSHEGRSELPLFALSLQVKNGHYWLIKTGQASDYLLDEYATQNQQYASDRSDVNSTAGYEKVARAEKLSFLLLLPVIMAQDAPLNELRLRIETMLGELASLQEGDFNDNLQEVGQGESTESEGKSELVDEDFGEVIDARQWNQKIDHLLICIEKLQPKIDKFANAKIRAVSLKQSEDEKKYAEAEEAASKLYAALTNSLNTFIATDHSKSNYEVMLGTFNQEINKHRPVLAAHRDKKKLIGNIIAAIAGLGIVYGIVLGINYWIYGKITFFQTDSEQKLDEISHASLTLGELVSKKGG